jgi:AcrR family transcriptional regulator
MADNALTRGEVTRRKIIEAAYELFIKQGYHGTSMRQIAQKAGIALGGLYNHFPGKEDVFRAVFLDYHPYREMLSVVIEAEGHTIEQVLGHILDQMTGVLDQHPQFLNLMFIELVEFKSVHANELFASIFPNITQIVQKNYTQYQEMLRSVPLAMFIRSLMGLIFSYYLTEMILAPRAPVEFRQDAREYLLDIYLHGILAKTEPY